MDSKQVQSLVRRIGRDCRLKHGIVFDGRDADIIKAYGEIVKVIPTLTFPEPPPYSEWRCY